MVSADGVDAGSRSGPSVRLKDVAALAGVSVKTVSNVVNDYEHVATATRDKVNDAIRALGYRPNLSARNLRRGRTGMIALAVPELDSPYFAELARAVIAAAAAESWTVLIDQTDADRDREQEAVQGLGSHLVDGLILSPLALGAEDLEAIRADVPLVLLGERVSQGPASHVGIDNVAAAREAVGHLAGLGRTRIAALGAQQAVIGQTAHLRLTGYLEALKAAGLPFDDALVAPAERYRRADGAAATTAMLDRLDQDRADLPDALFCFSDTLALGALRALHDRGLRVPEDVAVMGFDDVDDGAYSVPSLSTVAPDKEQIAREAVRLLAARVADPAADPVEVRTGHRVRARESTLGRSSP